MSSSNSLRARLAELLQNEGLTDHEAVLTGAVPAPVREEQRASDSKTPRVNRPDRSDRKSRGEVQLGRFRVGGSYKTKRIEMFHPLSKSEREMVDAAGFPRAAAVEIEGVGLLVDDMTRLMLDGRFLVLAFVDFPSKSPKPGGGKKR